MLRAHVERLEFFQRIAATADAQSALHNRVQVNEHVGTQQVVDDLLPHPVPGGKAQQVAALIGGVVINVQGRMPRPALHHVVEKVDQSLPFSGQVMRPKRSKAAVGLNQAEQVVEAPHRPLLVQRVALEVEKDVAIVGLGEGREGQVFGNFPARRVGNRVVWGQLQRRLLLQRGQGGLREPGHG